MNETYHSTIGHTQPAPEGIAYANMKHTANLASGRIGNVQPSNGEIETQIECLENQIKSLQVIAIQMSDRFNPILSGATDSDGKLAGSAPMYTQFGNRLFVLNAQMGQLRESLQDIIDRCKL